MPLSILIVDNFDSFTNNIADFLRGLRDGLTVDVVRNDRIDVLSEPKFSTYDGIIISPGPGNPGVAGDLGISLDILRDDVRPILGVCLGHQAMIVEAGGVVELAPYPMHGRVSQITTSGLGVFANLPTNLRAMRYHSWTVNPSLPSGYICDAWTDDGIVMGVRSTKEPRWGVQFHPESIATEYGRTIFNNFLDLVALRKGVAPPAKDTSGSDRATPRRLYWNRLGPAEDPVALIEAQGLINGKRPALLESSLVQEGLSRFSIIEVPDAEDRSVTYSAHDRTVTEYAGTREVARHKCSIFDFVERCLADIEYPDGEPPFPFHGGLMGWLGYELKSELLKVTSWPSTTPDAAFRVVTRFIVVDHLENATYGAVCLPDYADEAKIDVARIALQRIATKAAKIESVETKPRQNAPLDFTMRYDPTAYLERITACQDDIRAGESYELCLTNLVSAEIDFDAWAFYKTLRKRNPATYGGMLDIGGTEVISSSPERFLRVEAGGVIESKPIKGTTHRGTCKETDQALARTLAATEKERAENIMIVDLVRHDFAGVSIPGSVDVPKLCAIETYPSVHQMVSTIRGRLRPGLTCVDAIKSCFPGGSMTGAPKIRSVEILDRLEEGPRGIYSGAIGWIGFDGQADLSIVIRTVVKQGAQISIGCGGAITYLSEPEAELDEIMLKSRALVRALSEHLTGDAENYRFVSDPSPAPSCTFAE